MADATAGSPVSGLFRGAARAAEAGKEFSPAQEHYIGRGVAMEILARYKVHDDPALTDYVNRVGLAIFYSCPDVLRTLKGYHFVVLEADEVNAVSAPAGFVFLTLGAVKKAKSEDELAAVLAHEMAHVTLRHGIKSIKAATRQKAVALLVQGAGQTGAAVAGASGKQDTAVLAQKLSTFTDSLQDITGQLLVKGYSRDTELEADKLAQKFLAESKYSRKALVSFLQRLESGGKGGWFGTHPKPEDRIEAIGAITETPAVMAAADVRAKRFRSEVRA
jgi:predicted Zn-dependent protease